MLSEHDKVIIFSYAKQFGVNEIYVFGSSLNDPEHAHDIDLAVKGISSVAFFAFYGKLLRYLSKPVDVVNLSYPSRFTEMITSQAVKIYG
jgi:predicted nucleotidyltransferase